MQQTLRAQVPAGLSCSGGLLGHRVLRLCAGTEAEAVKLPNIRDTYICEAWERCPARPELCRSKEPHEFNKGCANACANGDGARCVPTLSTEFEPEPSAPPEKLPLRKILIKGDRAWK